jgi:hypothetical protein
MHRLNAVAIAGYKVHQDGARHQPFAWNGAHTTLRVLAVAGVADDATRD